MQYTQASASHTEQELRTLLANLPVSAAFVVGPDLCYRMAEGPALVAAGLTSEQMVGRSVREVMGPLADDYEALFGKALAGGHFEHEHQAHGRWFVSRGLPLKNEDGQVYAALAFWHDVTERKSADERVRRSQETFFGLVDHAPFGISIVDDQFRLVHISDGARKFLENVSPLLGCDVGQVLRQMWPAAFAEEVLSRFKATLHSGEPYRAIDSRERRLDLEVIQAFDWQLFRVSLPEGGMGVVCYFYDVTDLMSMQASLLRSQHRLELALSASGLGSFDWDVLTGEVQWDARNFAMFGADPATRVTADVFDAMLHPNDREQTRLATESALAGGDFVSEFRVNVEPAGERCLIARAVVLRDESGQPLRMIGVTEDVTETRLAEDRKRLQADRDAFTVALEAALRPLDDPHRLKFAACAVLGRAVGANCVNFGELDSTLTLINIEDDWTDGVPSVAGQWRVADFRPLLEGLAEFKRNVINDVSKVSGLSPESLARMREIQLAAFVGHPLARDGRWHAVLGVNCSHPVVWTEEQLWRIKLTAERTSSAVEQAQAELALATAEHRYRAFIAQSSEGIWRIEFNPPVDTRLAVSAQIEAALRDGRFAECNDQMAKMYGLADATSLIGQRLDFLFSSSSLSSQSFMASIVHGGYCAVDVESEEQDVHGHKRWFLNNLQGVVERDKLVRIWGTQRDISEQKSQQAALHASESRFRSLVMVVTDVPWTSDASGALVEPQSAWQAYTGQNFQQYSDFGWLDAVHPEDRERLMKDRQDSQSSLSTFSSHGRLWHAATHAYRHFVVRATPLLDSQGALHGWIGACNDVDDEKRSAELMREADRRKDAFLATLAHELRNPLAPLRTAATLLQMPGLGAEVAERARSVIERQTRHMALLLDDLLDVARITQGKLLLKKRWLLLESVLSDALDAVRPLLEAHGHQLHLDLPQQPINLHVDPVRLTQVLTNLLTNAANYTPEGGRIGVRVKADASRLRIDVKDNGIGISAKALDSIFEMFTQGQVDGDARLRVNGQGASQGNGTGVGPGVGLGLGLAIVKGLVELHGGQVSANSAGLGHGSSFTVHLPLQQALPNDLAAKPSAQPSTAAAAVLQRVLIADDNRDAAEMLASLLQARGHQTMVVFDGLAALKAAGEFHPAVAVLDIGMPGLDGYALAQSLRSTERGAKLRLAALTGWGQAKDRQRALEAGFNTHFTKPVDVDQLLHWVEAE